jgi:hypothetical protein
MERLNSEPPQNQTLRALIEITDGQLCVYPLADSDADERCVLQALRLFTGGEKK